MSRSLPGAGGAIKIEGASGNTVVKGSQALRTLIHRKQPEDQGQQQ